MTALHVETTVRDFEGERIDDGYEFIGAGEQNGWKAVAGWGRDGWDLGSWPYVVVLFRNLAPPRDRCTKCGGSLTQTEIDCLDADLDFVAHDDGHNIERMPRYLRAVYVEGDIEISTYATDADRETATDELALFYWKAEGAPWLDRGDDLKGPFSWKRLDETRAAS